jgi:hypothetical protein
LPSEVAREIINKFNAADSGALEIIFVSFFFPDQMTFFSSSLSLHLQVLEAEELLAEAILIQIHRKSFPCRGKKWH